MSITYHAMRRNWDWRAYQSLVPWKRAKRMKRCDWCLVAKQNHRSPPAPGRSSVAFPHHHLHRLPLGCSGPRCLCCSMDRSLRSFPDLEAEGPSTGRSRPVEGETTADTWTAAGEKEESYLEKENVLEKLKLHDMKCILLLTPGAVYLLTTKGPTWKSHSLKKMLNAGPVTKSK